MARDSTIAPLPLRWATPPSWVRHVLQDPLALLNDHAHLEKKAAANALELLNRWPETVEGPEKWVATMAGVARDEIEHLAVVTRLLARRGGRMSKRHRNVYAASLRKLIRIGRGPEELTDRLMVSALIELRSCERFDVLGEHCRDRELTKLYRGLCDSERGHYLVFINFARNLQRPSVVEQRWSEMLDAEARIMALQPTGTGVHSGVEGMSSAECEISNE